MPEPFTKNNQEPLEQPVVGVGLCSVEQHSKIQTLKSPAEEVSQDQTTFKEQFWDVLQGP